MLAAGALCAAPPPGLVSKAGRPLFPIGIYELPQADSDLKGAGEAGINLVRCYKTSDLDRMAAAGVMGWIPVPLELGADERLRKAVEQVKDHPALAAWEGPDEIVWSFTAQSGLYRRGIYKTPDEWWLQTPQALEHAEAEAARIMPKLREGARLVRDLDRGRHPLWINEAGRSDLKFIRQYIDSVDVTGCDVYPIETKGREPGAIGDLTERYRQIGRGKPVWMVLQAFSRSDLPKAADTRPAYPSFIESRMMAYAAITRGATGIFYYTGYVLYSLPAPLVFRDSIYALTSELAALQPFLTAPPEPGARIRLIETEGRSQPGDRGVSNTLRKAGSDRLLVLVNQDNRAHMGVEVSGLEELNGRRLDLLYGPETATVQNGEFITRLRPLEVKLFATSRKCETPRRTGRDFPQ
jgi:hypothetical protein